MTKDKDPDKTLNTGWLSWFGLFAGLIVTAIVTFALSENFKLKARQDFEAAMLQVESEIRTRVEAHIALLRGGSGLMATTPSVTAEQFKSYVDRLRIGEFYPGVQGIGLAMRITAANRDQVLNAVRAQGRPEFKVWPDHGQKEAYSIIYLEPQDARNRAAIGYDMFSEPIRRAAMEQARDTGAAAASGKVTLVQEIYGPRQPGFLVYVPVYDAPTVPNTMEKRRATIEAFVYSPFRATDLFKTLLIKPHVDIAVAVYDGTNAAPEALLFDSQPSAPPSRRALEEKTAIQIAGRPWLLEFRSDARPGGNLAWLIPVLPVAGVAMSLLLFYFTHAEARARQKLERATVELSQSEAEAQEQRERLHVTLSSIGDAVVATDVSNRIQFLNPAALAFAGCAEKDAIGKPLETVFQLLDERTLEPLSSPVRQVLKEGHPVNLPAETLLVGHDGKRYEIEDSAAPIRDARGVVIGVVLVFHDVTGQRQAEAFKARQARHVALRADVSATLASPRLEQPQVLHDCCDATVRHLDAAFARIWTLSAAGDVLELVASAGLYTHLDGKHSRIKMGEAKIGRIAAEKQAHLTNDVQQDPAITDPEWARREGMVSFAGYPLLVEGRVIGVLALFARKALPSDSLEALTFIADLIAQGIERRQAEQRSRENEERLRQILQTAVEGIITIDERGIIEAVNPSAQRIFGWTAAELIGRNVNLLMPSPDRERHEGYIENYKRTGKAKIIGIGREVVGQRKDGTTFPMDLSISEVRLHDRRLFTGFVRDITERKKAQQAIEKWSQELELRVAQRTAALQESYEQMETFTYSVAHDLRAPLRAMQGFASALIDEYSEKVDDTGKDFLRRIMRASHRMDHLIQDLLSYSQLTRSDLSFNTVNLKLVIRDVLQFLAEEIRVRHATVHTEGTFPEVIGHQTTLEHIIVNLVGNALKFVEPGVNPSVRIRAEYRNGSHPDGGTTRMVRLWVEDNGIGIAPEYQDRIFRVFERLHGTEMYPGTGMGLALVKKGIERMGGRVGVESSQGHGSRFWIELPAADKDAEAR